MAGAPLPVALLQLSVSDDPEANLPVTLGLLDEAVAGGARFVLTPEVTNCLSSSRSCSSRSRTTRRPTCR